MQSVLSLRLVQASLAAALFLALWLAPAAGPAAAQSLFARHQVTVEFATADGKPIADAEVRVFAPGRPGRPALTGRTDSAGKFQFPADADGMWSAEARSGNEIARVTVRVGGQGEDKEELSPLWLLGALLALLALAVAFRIVLARRHRAANPSSSPPQTPADR